MTGAENRTIRILAISGSLRAVSVNTAVLRAVQALAPEGVEVILYAGLGDLPHFNPDLEEHEPAAVTCVRPSGPLRTPSKGFERRPGDESPGQEQR